MTVAITALYILFVLSAIVLVVVILLQEGKGGGLTDALGTAGQQTFGVGASGINRFTGVTCGVFLASALAIHVMNRVEANQGVLANEGSVMETNPLPGTPGGAPAPAGGAPTTTPPGSGAPTPIPAPPGDGQQPKQEPPK